MPPRDSTLKDLAQMLCLHLIHPCLFICFFLHHTSLLYEIIILLYFFTCEPLVSSLELKLIESRVLSV